MEAARHSGAAITPNAWQSVVGARIASRTSVGRVYRGSLTIYAASAAWANELTFLSDDILARLRGLGVKVTAVRFKVKDFGPPPVSRPTNASPARPPRRVPLPASLEKRLALVDDPELRAAIAEAAALSLADYRPPTV